MPIGKPLSLRLFLEGEEIPVIAAQISIGMNSPAAASIQVVPLDEALDLKPRSMVHLFFLDEAVVSDINKVEAGTVTGRSREYRQIFAGETVGFSWIQSPQSRSLVLQCLDFSNYWDSAHATAIEYGPGGNAFTDHGAMYGSNTGLFDNIATTEPDQLVNWINQKPLTPGLTEVSGLAGGIITMLEAMGGVPNHHRGINDFFTMAELRAKLLQQVTAEEHDNTAYKVLSRAVMDQWVRNGLQNMGRQVTFRDMMKLLCQYIYYEFAPNPAPKLDKFTGASTPHTPTLTSYADVLQISKMLYTIRTSDFGASIQVLGTPGTVPIVIGQTQAQLVALVAVAKKRPNISSILRKAAEHLSTAATLLQKFVEVPPSDLTETAPAYAEINKAYALLTGSHIPGNRKPTKAHSQRLHSQILRPDCWFSAPPVCNVIFPEMYSQLSWERNYLGEVTRSLVQTYNTLIGKDKLLADYYLLPDIGEDSLSLHKYKGGASYRHLMDHELHTGIIPRSEWLANISAVGRGTDTLAKKKIHNARISWVSRIGMFHFYKYRFGPRQASVAGRFNPYMVCGFPAVIIRKPFIVSAGQESIKQRYEQLMTSAKTPTQKEAAALKDADILNFIYEYAADLGAPEQLVGQVAGLSHNIDQSGGTTSISMTHVRRHLGSDDEFLSTFIATDASKKRTVKTIITYDDAKADPQLMALLSGCTPQTTPAVGPSLVVTKTVTSVPVSSQRSTVDPISGQKVTITETTSHQVISESDTAPAVKHPLTVEGTIPGVHIESLLVPSPSGRIKAGLGNGRYAKNNGKVIGVQVLDSTILGDPKYGQVFRAVALYEEIVVPSNNDIPIEEIIRPSWFSASYANINIGSMIYEPFFGCGSVVDALVINGLAPTANVLPGVKDNPDASSFNASQPIEFTVAQMTAMAIGANEVSIEKAVTVLSYIYGQVKTQGLDVDAFIQSYIRRPIATKTDILGSDDLEVGLDSDGAAVALKGTLGFHSASVNGDLVMKSNVPFAGLTTDQDLHLPRMGKMGKAAALSARFDVRRAKKIPVLAYLQALQTRGLRG